MRFLDPIRSIFFTLAFYSFSILFLGLVVSPLCLSKSEKPARWGVGAYCRSCLWIARWFMGIKLEVRGLEHCPNEGSLIFAAAHQSNMDPMITYTVRSDVTALAKKELFSMPLVGRILKKLNIVCIDRQSRNAHKNMDGVGDTIVALGQPLIIYPQATRTLIGHYPRLKSGAYYVYKDTDIPVLPVATNTGLFWKKGLFHRSGTVVFEIGTPISPGLSKEAFMEKINKWIVEESDSLVREAGYGHLLPAVSKAQK